MKIAFAGTPEVAARVLKGLALKHEVVAVITRPDAPLGRRRVMTPSPVAELGLNLEIPVIKTTRVDDRIAQELADSGAELVVVVAYGSLIPKAALDVLPWWNLHFSQLPLWRGAAPVQHSIISGSGQGVSVFELDEGMDTGAVLASVAVELGEDCSTGEAMERLSEV
ncbi:MAG: methionyl-tRNA formyltransferase, partial [Aquiluna sp.]